MTALSLLSPLCYLPFEGSCGEFLEAFHSGEAGTDGMLGIAFVYSDGLGLDIVSKGLKPPLTEEEKRMLESGERLPRKPEETCQIPSGRYYFEQYPAVFSEEELRPLLLPWCGEATGCCIRFFKESPQRRVAQLFVPCR